MNKKVNLFLIGLLVFCISLTSINAKATYPTTNPKDGDTLYATVDEEFDFSKVKFGDAVGSDKLQKIFLGNYDTTNPFELKNSFSAYCLDASKVYPDQGYQYVRTLGTTNSAKYSQVMITNIFNSEFEYKKNELSGYKYLINVSPQDKADNLISTLETCKTNPSCELPSITVGDIVIQKSNSNELNWLEINNPIKVTLENSLYPKYKVEKASSSNVSGYEEAMWVISNTYPMITIDTMLSKVGSITLDNIKADIKTLEGTVTDELVDSYIYSTVQYAVWYLTGSKDAYDETIGSTMSAVDSSKSIPSLSKLYLYLITEGKKHNSYNPEKIQISIDKPEKPEEKETSTEITSGKYSFAVNSNEVDKIVVTIADNDDNQIKLLDENGEALTIINNTYELKSGQKFYVSIPRKSNITKVTLNAHAEGEIYDVSSSRKYSPYLVLNQSFITGRMTTEVNAEAQLVIEIAPATGVVDVAILLVVTLITFSMGYLVLGYKNKSIEI